MEKVAKWLARISGVIMLGMYIEQMYIFFRDNPLVVLSFGSIGSALLVVLYWGVTYGLAVFPLLYYGFRKEK